MSTEDLLAIPLYDFKSLVHHLFQGKDPAAALCILSSNIPSTCMPKLEGVEPREVGLWFCFEMLVCDGRLDRVFAIWCRNFGLALLQPIARLPFGLPVSYFDRAFY